MHSVRSCPPPQIFSWSSLLPAQVCFCCFQKWSTVSIGWALVFPLLCWQNRHERWFWSGKRTLGAFVLLRSVTKMPLLSLSLIGRCLPLVPVTFLPLLPLLLHFCPWAQWSREVIPTGSPDSKHGNMLGEPASLGSTWAPWSEARTASFLARTQNWTTIG